MRTISLGNNIASLSAQRRVAENSSALSRNFERLSSGLRINHASDDAAGLAIADSLQFSARVSNQAIRNLNDAISYLSIESAALDSVSQIIQRQMELASQAANGTYSLEQRSALNDEANALVSEFNRIIASTKFNSINIFENPEQSIYIQAGLNSANTSILEINSTRAFARQAGDGTFTSTGTFATLTNSRGVSLADFNNDGKLDLAAVSDSLGQLQISLGTGTGTFTSTITYNSASSIFGTVESGDLNGDGNLDLVMGSYSGNDVTIFLGQGNGTFKTPITHETSVSNKFSASLADLNSDNKLDLVTSHDGEITISLGIGDGTFKTAVSYAAGDEEASPVRFGDINGDGIVDLVRSDYLQQTISVYTGAGNGTFGSANSYSLGSNVRNVSVGDFNSDGYDDVAAAGLANGVRIFLNDGNGTLVSEQLLSGSSVVDVKAVDINNDGILDISSASYASGTVSNYLGSGDGTFSLSSSYSTGGNIGSTNLGDLNGDGVLDIVLGMHVESSVRLFMANTESVTTQARLDLLSADSARSEMSNLQSTLNRVNSAQGLVGASQSRISVNLNLLHTSSENMLTAEARIREVDIAQESAEMIRHTILQKTASAILASANQMPALVLDLLKSSGG